MSDSIQTRSEHAKLEAEVRNLRRLTQSSRYSGLEEEDKARLNERLKDCETRTARKKEELSDHIARLMEAESWPVVKQEGGQVTETEAGNELKYFEMAQAVAELRATVTKMNDAINMFIRARNSNAEGEIDMAMDVDGDEKLDNARPTKRRRTSQGAESSDEQSRDASDIIQREVTVLRDKLVMLEGRLSDLENDRIQQNRELMDEIEARIQSRLEDLDTGKPSATDSAALQQASDRLFEVEQHVNATGAQVDEIAVEIGSLITRSSSTEAEIARLRQELIELSAENTTVNLTRIRCTYPAHRHLIIRSRRH